MANVIFREKEKGDKRITVKDGNLYAKFHFPFTEQRRLDN